MKNELDSLLQKQMDRRDFLKHVGIGFVALTGVAGLLKTLNGFGKSPSSSVPAQNASSYGSSAYGGMPSAKR